MEYKMEFGIVVITVVAVLFVSIFFKSSIRKVSKHVESIVTTNIAESQVELTERAMEAYQDLIDECGEDFKTPEEIWKLMNKKRKVQQQKPTTN